METISKYTYSSCDPQVHASSVISINSFPIKINKILHVRENIILIHYSTQTKFLFIDMISDPKYSNTYIINLH